MHQNCLEQVLQPSNKYILQIAYSYNSYKFYNSGVITRRKKQIYNSGVIARRIQCLLSKGCLFKEFFRIMDWYTKSWRTKKGKKTIFSQCTRKTRAMTNRNSENEVGRGRALNRSLTAHQGRYLPRVWFQLRMSRISFSAKYI